MNWRGRLLPLRKPRERSLATHLENGREIIVNGDKLATCAATLDELVAELGFAGKRIATARNGDFVAERARARPRSSAATASRSSPHGTAAEARHERLEPRRGPNALSGALTLYGVELPSRLLLGTAQYPSPQVLARRGARPSRRRHRHGLAAARAGARRARASASWS